MSGKNKVELPQRDTEKSSSKPTGFSYVVSEGSIVIIDLHDFITEKEINADKVEIESCVQTGNMPPLDRHDEKDRISFTAPYVKDNNVNAKLTFELTVKDKSGKTRDRPYIASVIIKRVQRAIIFQGGVALGAYEAGAFRAIVEKLVKNEEDKKVKGVEIEKRPLFDIVAGASIGAMNGAIVISSVTEESERLQDKKNWEDSAIKVIEFWRTQQYSWPTWADIFDMNPIYHYWRDSLHYTSKVFKHSVTELVELYYSNMNPHLSKWYDDILANWFLIDPALFKDYIIDSWYIPATAEAARRYYSAKQFLRTFGAPNVATGIPPTGFTYAKFLDFFDRSNLIPRPDNKHFSLFSLRRTLERFARFPIKTDEGEPRLLLVAVDVQTGDAVTFDSYSVETKYHDDRNIIYSEKGIEIEHALATGTFPDFFDYPKFAVSNPERGKENEEHIFWDGGFRSNTPLREVIQAHRDYWLKARKKQRMNTIEEEEEDHENDVPDLEVYIADLWPSELREKPISFDRDFVDNRKWDLLLADKTHYDEQIAHVITDYVDLARRLKNLAMLKGASEDEINHILHSDATSINTIGKTRIYKELLDGRFRLTKVVRIDREDDGNEVHDKVFDYSHKTIEDLMKVGYQDALVQMDMQRMKDGIMNLAKLSNYNGRGPQNSQPEDLEVNLYKIEQEMKIQNGYGYNILRKVEDLIAKLESTRALNANKFWQSEKESVIAAAKQFKDTINGITTKNQLTSTKL